MAAYKFWGLLEYKPQWTITARGWLFILLVGLVFIVFFLHNIYYFLAYSAPVKTADALVVEGWIGDEQIKEAIAEFEKGNYQIIITTGLPIYKGSILIKYNNFAEVAAATLVVLGFDQNKIAVVPTININIHRTEASAIAVKEWLSTSGLQIKSLNIYSSGTHTRRSWLLFKRVFEPQIRVGAIASFPVDYNPKRWWKSSSGVKSIITETIAYFYTLFLG
ncbi:MAG: YdcF family protein [Gomphosphaeria aponina SAG 52.96 = DSM 107014]|uniref:YdcF family protein n=1 Tax=Gomphosphaeria aponina SAG 52.96 = DSM 107014 TaxID=1521640 RepID=A0A941JMA5_9CHRO|nr:YdcF family protein [Gomphosphaeria aponina SAG 52.96 = DSM 107014]